MLHRIPTLEMLDFVTFVLQAANSAGEITEKAASKGIPGFLPFSRATLMLDVVAVGMLIIIPILTYSLFIVMKKKQYALHAKIQKGLGLLLLIVVTLFEIDIRLHGWKHLAESSPYYKTSLMPVLTVHLCFAISTTLLWLYTIIMAMRKFDVPAAPNRYSNAHKKVARFSAITMYITAITGWIFYWMAFVS